MTTTANRAARRSEAKKTKNRKSGMVALSLLATTGLMSSYIATMRSGASFADVECELNYTIGLGQTPNAGTNTHDDISELSADIYSDTAANVATTCATITFSNSEDEFTGETLSVYAKLGTIGELRIFGNDVTLDGEDSVRLLDVGLSVTKTIVNDVNFIDGSGQVSGYGGAIKSDNTLEVNDSTFVSNFSSDEGGAIWADADVVINGSTFTSNQATNEGGAIFAWDDITVSDSTLNLNESGHNGGAIYSADAAVVSESTLENNGATRDGGAIYADEVYAYDSTFTGNDALLDGGAIRAYLVGAVNSTFESNEAIDEGGAIIARYDAYIINSTFVLNDASRGGAIYALDVLETHLSTFLDNTSDTSGASIVSFEGNITGNILAGTTGSTSQLLVTDPGFSNVAHNLSTGDDFVADSTNETVTFASLNLDSTLRDNGGPTETLALLSGSSSAVDFYPLSASYQNIDFVGVLPDQRGEDRVGALDAGAFEFGAAVAGTVTSFSPPFTVLDAKPVNTTGGAFVQITGVNLKKVLEVYVNGIKVEISSNAGTSLSFRAPAGLTGLADIRFVGSGHEQLLTNALNFSATEIVSGNNKVVIPGFKANSTKLTRKMKKAIRAFVKQNPELTTLTCKGFTSAPATPQDLRLASERGKVTCDFIKKINSDLTVKVLKGSHTNTPGESIRRVRIVRF